MDARSQDTGLAVLVVAIRMVANFSVTEKDETSPAKLFLAALLNTFILQLTELEGFCYLGGEFHAAWLPVFELRPGLSTAELFAQLAKTARKISMLKHLFRMLAITSLLMPVVAHAASYADSVVAYTPGTGFATDFSTGQGLTNATASLGEPSRATPGAFGGPVDPFNPPYLKEQLVSIGAGGSLTISFASPIRNDPAHPFGLDFTVFGNAGFVITNGNYSGGGITDGSLFGANSGTTRVYVSTDNLTYFLLDPARAPVLDGFFPTDGTGSFDLPVDPGLAQSDFAGLSLAGIRALYRHSAGGTGFDLSWAQDANGQPVSLPEVRFIRIDVLGGEAEIEGVAAVQAVSVQEDFAADPAVTGWRTFGDAQLFHWDSARKELEVTWDSSKPNSYFYHPLGTVVDKADNLAVGFDLRIEQIAVGATAGKPFTFELAIGLINLQDATRTNFLRGNATQSPNLVEFDYFPDSGFGATISPVIVSSNNLFVPSFTFPLELRTNDQFHVELTYTAATQTLASTLTRNGQPFGAIKDVKLGPSFTDFRVDTFAIASYSDQGADGSLLARGWVDQVTVTAPAPPALVLHDDRRQALGQITFLGRTGWVYTLERTEDWQKWQQASPPLPGMEEPQTLTDALPAPTSARAFYRVRLERP